MATGPGLIAQASLPRAMNYAFMAGVLEIVP
jgi:hypothetical protein